MGGKREREERERESGRDTTAERAQGKERKGDHSHGTALDGLGRGRWFAGCCLGCFVVEWPFSIRFWSTFFLLVDPGASSSHPLSHSSLLPRSLPFLRECPSIANPEIK